MPKKKAKRKVYFGQEVQDAIIEYNESNNNSERNQVYQNRIHKAFDKLAENIINNNNYKKLKSHVDMSSLDTEKKSDIANRHDIKQFTNEMIQYFEKNLPYIFKKQRDLNVAYSIIELMKKIDDIENFNKKSLYILIREMTDVNTSHITSVVNTLKKHYKKIFNEYFKTGNIIIDKKFF